MSEEAMQLLVAAFHEGGRAEEALETLKGSREEKLVGIHAAVALHKDDTGQIHFKDVGLTPAKGAVGGVVLGAVVGVLTGGTGIALGTLGALVGGLVGRKKRDSRFPTDRLNQVAAALAPGSSAIVIVMDPGWVVVLEKELEALGADVLSASISADVAQQIEANQEAAYAALIAKVSAVTAEASDADLQDPEKEEQIP